MNFQFPFNYVSTTECPRPDEYCALRKLVGLSPMDIKSAEEALPRSLFTICIRDGKKLIAMGRLVGDKGCFVQVVDIAVDPSYQKQGLSRKVMEALMEFINKEFPRCAVVSLFADVDYLYQKFGFKEPNVSKGMFLQRS